MKIEDLRRKMHSVAFKVDDCAKFTGLHTNTIYRLKSGQSRPSKATLKMVELYLVREGLL